MNLLLEQNVIKKFFVKNKRKRYLEFIIKRKRRREFTNLLAHCSDLKYENFIQIEGPVGFP
jgi:antitoxin component of MazEF toxin-antitoxin module